MKQIILVRHAKAMKSKEGLPDFVRSLVKKGVKQVKKISKLLKKQGPVPDLFISSPANRALETAQYVAKVFGYPRKKIILKDELYGPITEQEFLSMVKDLSDNLQSVIFFGHAPTISGFVKFLAKDFKDDMPTCGVAIIAFNKENWKAVAKGQGDVLFFEYPGRLAKYYTELKDSVGTEVFTKLMGVFKKIDAEAARLNEKKIRKLAKKSVKKYIKVLKKFRKTGNGVENIIKKETQKKEHGVTTPNKPVDLSKDTPVKKTPATIKTEEMPKQ